MESRKHREHLQNNNKIKNANDWDFDLHNDRLDKEEVVQRIRLKSKKIEDEAKKKENLLKLMQFTSANEVKEVNRLMVDSIKAKLVVLNAATDGISSNAV
jgi:hypothetical protein